MSDTRPDRHALLELDALLHTLEALRDDGGIPRFATDDPHRWAIHRLWIAAGNEALAHAVAARQSIRSDIALASLYDLRNHLAHTRLPDVDESLVQRFTWMRHDTLRRLVRDRIAAS